MNLAQPETLATPEQLSRRDVMINCALTVVPRCNGVQQLGIGAKDFELCQFAAELLNCKLPIKESHAKRALEEISANILAEMRRAGFLK